MPKQQVTEEVIEKFLEGRDPQKYIVAIEATKFSNEVHLIVNDPEEGKYIEKDTFKPFVWLKHQVASKMYGGSKTKIRQAMSKYKVKIKALQTKNANGFEPQRMADGFKYMAICDGSFQQLLQFFKEGGVDVYGKERWFLAVNPVEQYMIQTGKRMFKGMDDYDDLHRGQFDFETEGLDPKKDAIFQIGIRDNRGYEEILEVTGETPKERRESEKQVIKRFAQIIYQKKFDVFAGYNTENFDWNFVKVRCDILYLDFESIFKTLNPSVKIYRADSTLKLGQETEHYTQTHIWGMNIIDIYHAVRRAQAINSEIKKEGLKYITKFSKVVKPNRVYVDGGKINTTWADTEGTYYFNDEDGDWFKFVGEDHDEVMKDVHNLQMEKINSGNYEQVTGKYIVKRYLLDDLWETEQVDGIYNQTSFLISKILPTTYMRASTMGTSGTWKLIMMAWSYENQLAIPDFEKKREFTGGLSRLLRVGYAKLTVKFDFAALYPKNQLTNDIFPDLDISGVMKGLLSYVVSTRDKFKFLTDDEKNKAKKLQEELYEKRDSLSLSEIADYEARIKKHKKLESDYDKKQLPLKTLANSWFGSYGAPHIFPWGDTNSAEETTCRGRQYLRLMVRFFKEEYGFEPLVGDTDGFNFEVPENIDDYTYIVKANHWKTKKYTEGEELRGLDAVLARFNEEHMKGWMGLDIDDVYESTINFKRKNYANSIDGKVKLVGNSIKSKTMPVYIEEFIDKGIRLLLDGKGFEFIELYYDTVERIYNYQIPIAKIASKARVKESVEEYIKNTINGVNKAGKPMPRKPHMEIIIKEGLDVNLGDTIYYVNTGTVKSQSNIKRVRDKKTGKVTIELNCKRIPTDQVEANPNLTTDEYNVAKYLEAFNSRISSLLVCFSKEIRDSIIINVYRDKKTKKYLLDERPVFTRKQCELTSGEPIEEKDQDSYEELMTMEDKEIKFWISVNMIPNEMGEEEWEEIKKDYFERKIIEKQEGIKAEQQFLQDKFRRLEFKELEELKRTGLLPKTILAIADVGDDKKHGPSFFSKKWDGAWLCSLHDIFRYEEEAAQRALFYESLGNTLPKTEAKRFELWENHLASQEFLHGTSGKTEEELVEAQIREIEEEIVKYQQERLNTRVGLPPDHVEETGFNITLADVEECPDCGEDDEYNF